MKKYNVLIFPSGGENAINIYDSLRYNLHFNIYGASSKEDFSSSLYPSNNLYLGNLYINDPLFFDNFNKVIKKFNIDLIIPSHDEIAAFLMTNEDKINAQIVCSNAKTTVIANSKKKTYEALKGKEYLPKIYTLNDQIDYPVFIKPDISSGGKNAKVINNEQELKLAFLKNDSYVICEYLNGEEYTIDCFTDRHGNLLFIGPRTRQRITMGISFFSKTIALDEDIKSIANDLNNTLNFRGAWFFQLKKDSNNKYKLLELCVRQAGTMALYRELGVNFALLSLFDKLDMDVNILKNDYSLSLNRRLSNAYNLDFEYNNLYIDFDDTLIIDDKVNTLIIKLIYQSINDHKNVYLITRHENDISEDLKKYHIDSSLFTKVYNISKEDKKSNYIKDAKSVFIDNYFQDRKDVLENCHIPVFDVDAAECLIKYSQI